MSENVSDEIAFMHAKVKGNLSKDPKLTTIILDSINCDEREQEAYEKKYESK